MTTIAKEVSIIQLDLASDKEWEHFLKETGVWVVDVYQEWCGPTLAMYSILKKLKNEMGDEPLNYATANADAVQALEAFRGDCEPTWLFYADGNELGHIKGADARRLTQVIMKVLKNKKEVTEGKCVWKMVNELDNE